MCLQSFVALRKKALGIFGPWRTDNNKKKQQLEWLFGSHLRGPKKQRMTNHTMRYDVYSEIVDSVGEMKVKVLCHISAELCFFSKLRRLYVVLF